MGSPLRGVLRPIVANIGWLLADRAVRLVLAFFVGTMAARYLGPRSYGELAYLLAVVSLLQACATLGMDSLVVRDLAHGKMPPGVLLGTATRLRVIAGLIGWCGTVAFVALSPGESKTTVAMAAVLGAILFFQSADVVDLWFQSQVQSRFVVPARLTAALITAGLRVGLVVAEAPLWTFVVAIVFESALAACVLISVYRRHGSNSVFSWDGALALHWFRQAWPLLLAGLSVSLYMRLDQVMLRQIAGPEQAGYFAAATSLSQVWVVLPSILLSSVVPNLSKLFVIDRVRFFYRLQLMYSLVACIGVFFSVLNVLCSRVFVSFLYGPSYTQAAAVLAVHGFASVFMGLGAVQASWIFRPDRTWVALAQTLTGVVASVVCNLVFISRFGAVGAAISAVVAQTASVFLANFVLDRQVFYMQCRALLRALWPIQIYRELKFGNAGNIDFQ